MKAEIIASGTELLLGETVDTNTSFIASQLPLLGIDLYYASIVGDNYERFLGTLKQAYHRSDLLIITGGLGPTRGDITREVIAGLMGEKMEVDPALKQQITEYFSRLHLEMPENNLKQATLIPSATAISNPLGTAPGWWVEKDGKIIVSMPGPPGEMQPMWQTKIFPRLEKRGGAVIISRNLKTWGLSEAKIDQMVAPFMAMANPTLALYARPDGIRLRVTAKSTNREEAIALIRERENSLREILGDSIWGVDNDNIEEMIANLLINKHLSVAVAESFTGGLLSCSLASVPESRQFYRGGIIAVDEKSRALLEIVSKTDSTTADIKTASQMATIAREKFGADIGIGIDGFSGSENSSTLGQAFIAINVGKNEHNFSQPYSGRSGQLARRAVMNSIFSLRKVLLGL